MVFPITVTGTNPVVQTTNKKLIAVSDNTGDTSQSVSLTGLSSGVGVSESVSLAGKVEVSSANAYDTLNAASLSASVTGTVTLHEEGNAATGYVIASGIPSDGDTVPLGLTGHTQTYTFRAYGVVSILCKPQGNANFATGAYFDLKEVSGTTHRFWYNINSGGGAPSTPGGSTLTAIAVALSDTAITIATATVSAINGLSLTLGATNASGASAQITITSTVLGQIQILDNSTSFAFGAGTAFVTFINVTCKAQGSSGFATGDYFDIIDGSAVTHRFWYNINSGGGAPSTPGGGTLTAIAVTTGENAASVGLATSTAINGASLSNIIASGGPTVLIEQETITGTMTVIDGASTAATGFTIAAMGFTWSGGTVSAANQVAIGSSVTACMASLAAALQLTGTAGVDYGSATVANAFLSGVAAGAAITLTDLIKCARQLTWACSTTSAVLSIVNPFNGVSGALIATLTGGNLSAFNSISMDNEALSENNLPALLTPTSDTIRCGGGVLTIEALLGSGSNVSWKIQTSTDAGTTWRDAGSAPSALVAATLAHFTLSTNTEYFRVVFTTNSATSARALHMKAVFR